MGLGEASANSNMVRNGTRREDIPMSRILGLRVSPRAIAARFRLPLAGTQKRAAFAGIIVLAATLSAGAQSLDPVKPEQVGLSSERLERIGKIFNQEIDQGKLPGAVVLVARKGRVAYFESFGFRDKAAGTQITKDSLFEIYSMTKPFVSVAAMMLVEEGRMQLADPVAKFLPEFANVQVSVPKFDAASGKLTYGLTSLDRPITVQICCVTPPGSSMAIPPPMLRSATPISGRAS
jgi:CubicO group peptidase (beta-lactamase class C family)